MPIKTSSDELTYFVQQLDAAALSSVLIELAEKHAAVRDRLVRLQLSSQPKALASVFRKKLAAWKRSTKYIDWSQVNEFGRELGAWLKQVEREVLPLDPNEALALAEAFIESDEHFFNHADDSGAVIRRRGAHGLLALAEGGIALRKPSERLAESHRDAFCGRPIRCP